MQFRSNRFFWFLAGAVAVHAACTVVIPEGYWATVVGDAIPLALAVVAFAAMFRNSLRSVGILRVFWLLLALGCLLWIVNQGAWTWYEAALHREPPDVTFADPLLFLHLAPFIAAVGLLPHLPDDSRKLYFSTFNTVILTVCWLFAYAFFVVPHEFVVFNLDRYNTTYTVLYTLENALLAAVLALAVWATRGHWRKLYLHLFVASILYYVSSQILNEAINSTPIPHRQFLRHSLHDRGVLVCMDLHPGWHTAIDGAATNRADPAVDRVFAAFGDVDGACFANVWRMGFAMGYQRSTTTPVPRRAHAVVHDCAGNQRFHQAASVGPGSIEHGGSGTKKRR